LARDSKIKLTSGEISQLWSQYLSDSSSSCLLRYFLEKVEDDHVRDVIKYALKISQEHLDELRRIFKEEDLPIPKGFNLEEDVNIHAPRLYSDIFMLNFIHQMAKVGLSNYGASLGSTVRSDITNYYKGCLKETVKLFEISKEVLLEKGVFERDPMIPYDEKEFIKSQKYLMDFFGVKRPLSSMEASNLFANCQRNAFGSATLLGFSQVATNKNVTKYFLQGIEIGNKHVDLFSKKLHEFYLAIPKVWGGEVTDCTDEVFSEKLMMFFVSSLNALSIGFYGTAISQSQRGDLSILYNRLSMEIQLFAEDGMNIMIQNKWMEQPPLAPNRKELSKEKFE